MDPALFERLQRFASDTFDHVLSRQPPHVRQKAIEADFKTRVLQSIAKAGIKDPEIIRQFVMGAFPKSAPRPVQRSFQPGPPPQQGGVPAGLPDGLPPGKVRVVNSETSTTTTSSSYSKQYGMPPSNAGQDRSPEGNIQRIPMSGPPTSGRPQPSGGSSIKISGSVLTGAKVDGSGGSVNMQDSTVVRGSVSASQGGNVDLQDSIVQKSSVSAHDGSTIKGSETVMQNSSVNASGGAIIDAEDAVMTDSNVNVNGPAPGSEQGPHPTPAAPPTPEPQTFNCPGCGEDVTALKAAGASFCPGCAGNI